MAWSTAVEGARDAHRTRAAHGISGARHRAGAPGEAVVVQLFGGYLGTIRNPGLTWVLPWATRHRVLVRIRSYQTPVLKVNDADGNPIEIAVVVVWQVADTARAVFAVDDVTGFVAVQAEIAARQTVSCYPMTTTAPASRASGPAPRRSPPSCPRTSPSASPPRECAFWRPGSSG
ncbi:MAG TPA: SPFH domain-containing protein [Trebonia sp.]